MNNGIKCAFAFTLGAAISAVVTWKIVKTKYEQIAQEEIDSVKEMYARKAADQEAEEKLETLNGYKAEVEKYAAAIPDTKGGSESMDDDEPEVIPPDEFGDIEDYEQIGLVYYADDVIADDLGVPVADPDAIVGPDALGSFGEWEDDSVHVRNDERKAYYEILRDERCHSDLNPKLDEE